MSGPDPAFPLIFTLEPGSNDIVKGDNLGPTERRQHIYGGISRRDYFAAAALTGIMAHESVSLAANQIEHHARLAFQLADAMLERTKK